MDDLLRDFLTESNENLQKLDVDIVELERSPEESSLIHGIFRTIHTIKGTCGFIGLNRLEAVAHSAESVLGAVREGKIPVTPAMISDVLAAVDVIKGILEVLDQTEQEPEGDDSALIATLDGWLTGEAPATVAAPVAAPAPAPVVAPVVATVVTGEVAIASPAIKAGETVESPTGPADVHPEARGSVADSSLRVNVNLLDKLMTLVGELVLDRNRLIQLAGSLEDSEFAAPVQHLNRVTSDLQEAVMKTRMQPIGSAWTKLPRLVRDLASASGKQITLEMNGAETELDRQILQAIGDPLTHMVRNSGDHGIEQAAVRIKAGKPANGTIRLNAFHEGGHVIIEIVDDGAGINVDRVRQKAIERGLVKPEVAATLHDAAVLRFIFEPGFSTADKITNVSGRGVGMDVVRTNIERIGGTVDLQSEPGKGSTVRIKIPLTLAIIPALVVVAAENRYAIPQVNLLELVRLEGEAARQGVESLHGAPVYRLRGRLLPLVYLRKALRIGGEPANTEVINIVVVQADGRPFGLVVDGVSDTEEIVVKPMSRQIKQLTSFAGTTIMGDGRVSLILDVPGLARGAHVVDESRSRDEIGKTTRAVAETVTDLRTLLVVRTSDNGRLAIPLDRVNRLEEFKRSQIERSLGRDVVQYRDSIMPLVHVAERLGLGAATLGERVPVVVHATKGQAVGLVVGQIVDIVEQQLVVQREAARPGILGTAVIQGQVTDLLDLEAMLSDHDAAFAAAA